MMDNKNIGAAGSVNPSSSYGGASGAYAVKGDGSDGLLGDFRLDVDVSPNRKYVRFSIVKTVDETFRYIDLTPEQAKLIAETILSKLDEAHL